MTTGTNLQLTYNENTDSWSYQNVDYEYPSGSVNSWSGYTTADPEFEFAPTTEQDQEQDNDTVCPPGYIYDETLLQCVPDPNYTAPAYAGEPGRDPTITGGDKPIPSVDPENPLGTWVPPERNPDGTWADGYYKQFPTTMAQFTAQDLFDYGKSKGYIDNQGSIIGPMQTTAEGLTGTFGQAGNQSAFNNWLNFVKKEGAFSETAGKHGEVSGRISFPLSSQIANIPGVALSGFMHNRWIDYINTIDLSTITGFQTPQSVGAPSAGIFSQRGLSAPGVSDYRTFEDQEAELEQERKQELHEEKLEQEKIKTERAQFDLEKSEREDDSNGMAAAAQQERVRQRQAEKEAGTGGSFGRDEDRPVMRPEPKEPKTGQGGAPIWRL